MKKVQYQGASKIQVNDGDRTVYLRQDDIIEVADKAAESLIQSGLFTYMDDTVKAETVTESPANVTESPNTETESVASDTNAVQKKEDGKPAGNKPRMKRKNKTGGN